METEEQAQERMQPLWDAIDNLCRMARSEPFEISGYALIASVAWQFENMEFSDLVEKLSEIDKEEV